MMNAHQGNPFVDIDSGKIGSVSNFDTTRLFNVLTYVQTALGSLLLSLVRRGERKVQFPETLFSPPFHVFFPQINEFVHLNKEALVEHYILWHLESQCKTTLTLSQAVPISFARMSGAQGIEIGLQLFQKSVQD